MARKWERMVEKNTKTANKQRAKQGKTLISGVKDAADRFYGRSWLLPLFLICFSIFFMIAFGGIYRDSMYWLTSISYFLLGVIIFFFRRPNLIVEKNELSSRRFSGQKYVKASDLELITISPGYIIIQLKASRSRWVFSRLIHRMNTELVAIRLKEFAQQNDVALKEEH